MVQYLMVLNVFVRFSVVSEEIIVVNMDSEPSFKKMETVVKLDSVSLCNFYS